MSKPGDITQSQTKTWAETASDVLQNHTMDIAVGALGVAAIRASRGKLEGMAEKYLPNLGVIAEEGAAGESSLASRLTKTFSPAIEDAERSSQFSLRSPVAALNESHAATNVASATMKELKYDLDPVKINDMRALPSMTVINGKLEKRITLVDDDTPLAQTYDKLSKSVFHLHENWKGDELKVGTAFLTEDNYLITAQHCTVDSNGTKDLFVRLAGGEDKLPLSLVAKDYGADVALLKFKEPVTGLPEPIPLGWSGDLTKADTLATFGFPASANKMVVTEGRFEELENIHSMGTKDKADELQVVAPSVRVKSRALVWNGNSGGPVMSGDKAVAVVTTSMNDVGASRATSIEHVRLLIEQARKDSIPENLQIRSVGRILGQGNKFTVKVQKLDVTASDEVTKPTS